MTLLIRKIRKYDSDSPFSFKKKKGRKKVKKLNIRFFFLFVADVLLHFFFT